MGESRDRSEPRSRPSAPVRGPAADVQPGRSGASGVVRRIVGLQRLAGNGAVASALAAGVVAVQRHNPSGADPVAGSTAASAGAPPAQVAGATVAPPTTLPDTQAMSSSAVDAIKKSFGSLRTITPAPIIAQPVERIWQSYAQVCNRDGAKLPDGSGGQRAWTTEDAKARGILGFYDANTNTIYVNTGLPILGYVHELLHRNTADGFDALTGRAFDEGCTDRLALAACKAAGIADPGPPGYIAEMAIVERVVGIVGEASLRQAYFVSPPSLTADFDAYKGQGSWARFVTAMNANDTATVVLLTAPATEEQKKAGIEAKVARIRELFGGTFKWVSDDDIELVVTIVKDASDDRERRALQNEVRDHVHSLVSGSQRDRLRIGCDLL